jgi:hypothetical protein
MKHTPLFQFLVLSLLASLSWVNAEQVLIHAGPAFSTPGLGQALPTGLIHGEEITYRRMFYIDKNHLPRPRDLTKEREVPVTAKRAITLIIERDKLTEQTIIKRLELLTQASSGGRQVDYYLIEYEHSGSTEYRVVLMNEIVIAPTLEKPRPQE